MAIVVRETNIRDYTLKIEEYINKGYKVVCEGKNFPTMYTPFDLIARLVLKEDTEEAATNEEPTQTELVTEVSSETSGQKTRGRKPKTA